MTVAVLFGGASNEHDVSLRSARAVIAHLPKDVQTLLIGITREGAWYRFSGSPDLLTENRWLADASLLSPLCASLTERGVLIEEDGTRHQIDAVFPVLHGQNCEDGRLQGFLDTLRVPYVGCGCSASVLGMDKVTAKIIAEQGGIPVARFLLVTRTELGNADGLASAVKRVEEAFPSYPVFVKAVCSGSSVGAYRANGRAELENALTLASEVDERILVEEFMVGKEVECAVLQAGGKTHAFTPGEIDPGAEFYDYDTKYSADTASYFIPARVSDEVLSTVRTYASRIFELLSCRHLSRVDFFVTEDGRVIFNEINTLPGFTSISMYPKLCEHGGVSFDALVAALVKEALS